MSAAPAAVEVFCCYAHEDEAWLQKLEIYLKVLKRQGIISLMHDRLIVPGTNWAKTIDAHVETASILLLLVSADFFLSDYCNGIEMTRAMERQKTGKALVIPILIRPVDWYAAPFAHLQVLPTDNKPLSTWPDEEMALMEVTAGIRHAIETLPLLSASAPRTALPAIWNIPYPRNPFFIGRETELAQIRQRLQAGQTTALSQPQALSGLGGIGKTQIALEYAYRYRQDYQMVLWARAESTEALVSSYVAIASLLRLPEREAKEQEITVQAVKIWLQTHHGWLLILDNADELALLSYFLPPSLEGHLILTTRASATGRLARRMEIDALEPEQGALFLLNRAGLITPNSELSHTSRQEMKVALQISQELGRLPLALDQAGAYMEETGIGLAGYWHLYQVYRSDLLQGRRGLVADHPVSVATTWSLSLHRVEQRNLAAVDLLRLCAFLAPDAIPEEIITQGDADLGPYLTPVAADPFLFSEAIENLRAYSLLGRNPRGHLLSMNRLVQAVLQDTLQETEKRTWVERALLAVNAVFPHVEHSTWAQCERLLPQALAAAQSIEQYQVIGEEAGRLLSVTAAYLQDRARYAEAEPFYQQALHIRELQLGPNHTDVASSLNDLALLYWDQGKYTEAEPLYVQALAIQEQQRGVEHPDTANTLHNLASLYRSQGKYELAEPLYLRVLRIREQQLGVEHPDTANTLHNLALLYDAQGKYEDAEPLYQQALSIREQQLGAKHPDTARSLNNLASLYIEQNKYSQAEPLFQRALHILTQVLGIDHPETVYTRNNLTSLHANQGQKSQVQRFFEDAGFKCMGFDEPDGFLGIPETPLWQKKFKHTIYMRILTGKRLDGNDVLLMHGAVQKLSKDITLAFAIVDKPVDDHAWLQIAALRAYNFSVIPIPFTLIIENQTLDKVINASALLDKHVERFLGQGADPYNIRHPIFDVLNFFGREAIARDLIERMNSGQSIGLFGLRKMGKSSLMQYMRGLMPCPTAYLDLQAGIEPISLYKRILRSWDKDARVRFRTDLNLSDANLSTEDPTTEFVKITQATLDKIADRKQEARLAIFLDEIELIIPPLDATGTTLEHYLSLMRMLRGLVQEDGRILLMVAGVDPAINHMSRWGDEQKQNPFFMLLEELYLPPLFESDCIQMVRNIGTQVQLSYSEEATAYVAQMSGGHPYLARQLCSLAYKQRHQRMGELTLPAMQQAVERFLFDPKYASSINASGLWGEVTNVKLWGEQTARANQDILFMLAQSTAPLAESVITNGFDQVALRSALFSLQELNVIRPIEHPSGSSELCYAISFGLFHSWIRRVRLGLEGES